MPFQIKGENDNRIMHAVGLALRPRSTQHQVPLPTLLSESLILQGAGSREAEGGETQGPLGWVYICVCLIGIKIKRLHYKSLHPPGGIQGAHENLKRFRSSKQWPALLLHYSYPHTLPSFS